MAVAINTQIHPELVAPCGINCALCKRYLAFKNKIPPAKGVIYCEGCRPSDRHCTLLKPACRRILKLAESEIDYCCDCNSFPCEKLSHLDVRYRENYGVSPVDNLEEIRDRGLAEFLEEQSRRYSCEKCGSLICMHDKKCYKCERPSEAIH